MDDNKKITPGADALFQAVMDHMAGFRAANGGQDPTLQQVTNALGRRKEDVRKAFERLREEEAAEAAQLAALPPIPDLVAAEGERLVMRIWIAAHETASLALAELRRQVDEMARRARQREAEHEEVVTELRDENAALQQRVENAETSLAAAGEEIARLTASLSHAEARLDERDALVELVRAASAETAAGKSGARKVSAVPAVDKADEAVSDSQHDEAPGPGTASEPDAEPAPGLLDLIPVQDGSEGPQGDRGSAEDVEGVGA
jgi:hypothetical protein